jgi:oxygen-dependent protoporphyrinogen oxidase
LTGGLARRADELVQRGAFRVRTGLTVRSIRRVDGGFVLDCGPLSEPEQLSADAVVVATPAPKAARLLTTLAPVAAADLDGIETASMAIVSLALSGVAVPPGSGLLVGAAEQLATKAITVSSQKWPGAPAGMTLLRASIGRVGQVRELQHDDGELIAQVRSELPRLLGITAAPIDALVTRWGGGLPQFAVGHVERVARIRAEVARIPGLAVCGASYDGVGIPACIASATRAVEAILAQVEPAP